MKKVLLVSGSWPPARCGVGIYTYSFYTHMASNNNLTFSLLTSEAYAPKIPSSVTTPEWRIRDLRTMLKGVKNSEPDLVHIQYPTLPYKRQLGINLLPWLLRVRGYGVILTMHEYFQTSRLGKIRSVITALPAKRIVVSNQADIASLPKFLRKKSQIIPLGPTINITSPDSAKAETILQKAGLQTNKQTVVFFGQPFSNKRLDILIEAARNFSDGLQLLLVFDNKSSDPYVKEIVARTEKLIAGGAPIGFAGYLSDRDLSSVLHEAMYFVLPQTHPPLTAKSSTAIVAALHGCVVIASELSPASLSTPFTTNKNCVLLPDMNSVSLAEALNELSENNKRREALIKQALELANYFSWPIISSDFAMLYEEIS